ncbi:MAG: Ni/Fe hydrogenase subunit alpha [Acidithiobacillus ferriphilus]|jgi:coenzyme F420-reducing hydrogenase alpha subunit|uniref:Ni/Fe hydrogenase subunit alpha n=1 Tax=Acidithiobacillus ferriphilus TaxID=1689834 RepID=UPI00242B9F8C|nr:nickel-dependent hydrogenase large subunit [Acidithiobacillus ferriphilus]MBW9248033.1 Ni/Fe hydrogenase subunit alpha [Acidithiobacillus ferriphilus]MBW9254660.1 Ni/Fe hydrogenase subunit alpha [Acidithiobacillus ferriphilus]
MTQSREISLCVPVLARVEGEGALDLEVHDGRIQTLRLRIFEPPRLFEKFLEGREYQEIPDMVARICGICPVAYQMSAVHAIEGIFGLAPGPWVRAMRRVFYCGEWIQSHSLHIHLLAAPDFLGYSNVSEMARAHPDVVRRGLALQALGNEIIRFFGGRSVHPVGARVGGFHRAPSRAEVAVLQEQVRAALPEAAALVAWTAALNLPDDPQDFVSVALRHRDEYPMNEGRIVSSDGLDMPIADYESHFREHQEPHSTALYAALDGRPYLVGPLARLNLNLDRLHTPVREALGRTGIAFPSRNMFHSIVARAAEIHYALLEASRLLEDYTEPEAPFVPAVPRSGIAYGCTEAPRGLLWHRYDLDAAGQVLHARIVPPTSQNQARIEADLRHALETLGLDRDDETLRQQAEMVIRNYDPCISCATHFLTVRVERR